MTFAVVCLASAVFLWGTEYKCSLYHKHLKKHPRIAAAKLLSEQERRVTVHSAASARFPLSEAVRFAPGMLRTTHLCRKQAGMDPIPLPRSHEPATNRRAFLIHSSVRPPPRTAA